MAGSTSTINRIVTANTGYRRNVEVMLLTARIFGIDNLFPVKTLIITLQTSKNPEHDFQLVRIPDSGV